MGDLFVGKKPHDTYLRALEEDNEVAILARGTYIKKAVDVALMAKRLSGYEITETSLYNEKMQGEDDKEFFVSAVKIILIKQK